MRSARKGNPPLALALGSGAHSLFRLLARYRVEVVTGGALLALGWLSMRLSWLAYVPMWMTVVAVLAHPESRSLVDRLLRDSSTRRRLEHAARDSGLEGLRVGKVSQTMPGELVDVRVPRGATVDKLDAASRAMAGCLRVSDVRVIHDREDRSHAQVSIVRRDPFRQMNEMRWPLIEAESTNLRKPFPFGLDEYGRVVEVKLLSRNLILGGAPDAGKSASLRVVCAAAALDPRARLWMMDAKTGGAEFVHWAPAAEEVVRGRDLEAAVRMLKRLERRVVERGQEIVSRGEVFVCDDMELDVLVIDELPQFTRSFQDDSKEQAAAVKVVREGIWRLIAMGRWAGMITVLSAQKPTADIVPSESRDLIDLKFALHCNTRAMSDAVLGDGSGSEVPVNAAEIPTGQPGVGYLLAGDGARKVRTFFVSHKQALEVATRATSRQIDAEWLPA